MNQMMNNNIFSLYQQLRQNPMAMIAQRFNLSKDVNVNDPNAIIQDLLNTGQVTQAQVNHAMNMRNNPAIQMLMRGGR